MYWWQEYYVYYDFINISNTIIEPTAGVENIKNELIKIFMKIGNIPFI